MGGWEIFVLQLMGGGRAFSWGWGQLVENGKIIFAGVATNFPQAAIITVSNLESV